MFDDLMELAIRMGARGRFAEGPDADHDRRGRDRPVLILSHRFIARLSSVGNFIADEESEPAAHPISLLLSA